MIYRFFRNGFFVLLIVGATLFVQRIGFWPIFCATADMVVWITTPRVEPVPPLDGDGVLDEVVKMMEKKRELDERARDDETSRLQEELDRRRAEEFLDGPAKKRSR